MKEFTGCVLCAKGMENVSCSEIKRLIIPKSVEIQSSCIMFKTNDLLNLPKLCYLSQSANRVMLVLDKFNASDIDEYSNKLNDLIKKSGLNNWISNDMIFGTECLRENNDSFSSIEIEQETTKAILADLKEHQISAKPAFKNPSIVFMTYINNDKCIVGIDFAGFDLSRRSYKIFPNKNSLKGPLGFALINLIDYKISDFLLNVGCADGVVAIEAAMFATGFPVRYYSKDDFHFTKFRIFEGTDFPKFFAGLNSKMDSKIESDDDSAKISLNIRAIDHLMGNVVASKKNAKIAGIIKNIDFSRISTDWLDVKMKEGNIDKIIALLPQPSKNVSEAIVEKQYKEFFYQAEYILKDNGRILFLIKNDKAMRILKEKAEEYKFKITEEHKLWQGSQEITAVIIFKAK